MRGRGRYAKLYEPAADGMVRFKEAACWAHLRRDFHDVWAETNSEIAREALDRIGALYDIERDIAGQPVATRLAARQKLSRPKVEAFFAWSEGQLTRIPGKGDLGKAFRYGLSRVPGFSLFLEDGRVAIDNNPAERALRPIGSAESLYPSSSSIWKHLHLLWADYATRASFPSECLEDAAVLEIRGLDLPWRTRDDLLSRQDPALDHPPHDVAGHSELRRGLAHGEPDTVLLGRAEGVDAADPADGSDAVGRPGLVLAGAHPHPVQGGRDIGVGKACCHAFHHGKSLLGRLATMFPRPRLADAQLRVLAAAPVDRQHDLPRCVVDVGDDVRDQRPDQLLAAPGRDVRRRPGGGDIRGQAVEVGHRHRRIGSVHRGEARPAGLHAAQRGFPVLLELRRDETALRVAGGVAPLRERGVILGLARRSSSATPRRSASPSLCIRSASSAASMAIGSTTRSISAAIAASTRDPPKPRQRGRPSMRLGRSQR